MISRRMTLLLAAGIASLSAPASAGYSPFGTANFRAALEAGGPVLVHIDASWCPTCRAQKPILAKLLSQRDFAGVRAFAVDYDTEKAFMREISAPDRSTIIMFRNGGEAARSTGDTAEERIEALIRSAL
ncbi:thioredoxin family protein [Hansschlegelia zhihuaiae]|uniref:Thioredoxin n=1 Tax=Hansschlegelia zhihuaiae TaxID=405005 RepID=A0A4Q0MLL3_9HYPH|nr:thioredoxin family protein [Hansschlegelia zhihuaiae]RXF74584.1 thioredoxin [Hansschlegelia zhihuaiae]